MSKNKYSLKKLDYLLERKKGERIHLFTQLHLFPFSAYALSGREGDQWRASSLNLSIADALVWIILHSGGSGVVLCSLGSLTAFLLSTQWVPGALPQSFPNVPLGQHCPWLRTTNLS